VFKFTNPDGSVATSNSLPVTCSDSAYTYTAKLDKSTYAPGDLATLSVTFKDSKGNLAADTSAIATTSPIITGGNFTPANGAASNAGTTSDALTNGVAAFAQRSLLARVLAMDIKG